MGQRVSVETASLAGIDPLLQKDFVITGVFKHPDHVSFMVSAKPYLLVPADSFNCGGLEGAFMKTRILVEGAPRERFSKAYFDMVKPVENAIVSLADEQAQRRSDKFRAAINEELEEGRQRVDDGKRQLEDGRRKLEDSRKELEEKRGEALSPADGGVLVPGRLLEYYRLHVGDELMLYNTRMNRMEAPIIGSFNNHFGQLLFFTPAGYEAAFGREATHNCFLVRLGGLSLDELQEKLTGIEGFESLQDAYAERERFDNLSAVLNLVIAMLLVLAAVMSYFILMNLSMTYIQRKTKELTIMRINGFTVAECVRYAAWDLVLTTAAGIVLGLAVGHPIAVAIVKLVEQSHLQFVREADVRTFIYCALIMLGFSLAINGVALSKIRNLKLSDAM